MHGMIKVLFLCLLFVAAAALAEDAPTYRELPCRVVDEMGQPARGVAVRLGGLERDAPDFEDDDERIDTEPGWKFVTDGDGRFTARFGQFHPYQRTGTTGPGYGAFYFVVYKVGFAGGVSREVLNLDDDGRARWQQKSGESRENQEWRRGEFAPLVLRDDRPISEGLVIVLKRGLDVRGRMVDTTGRPVRGQSVGVSLDLHYGSHTGAGGMIFSQGTTTDRAGHFHLRHVYPNVFTVLATSAYDGPFYWIKTRVRDHWVDQVEDEITPRRGGGRQAADYEKSIDMYLVVSRRPLYRYYGRVTDEKGHPLARTAVIVRSVLHAPVRSWGESHAPGQTTRTDDDGNYSLRVGSRFVDGIWVREGDHDGGIDTDDDDQLLAPGRHDFTVGPKKPGR